MLNGYIIKEGPNGCDMTGDGPHSRNRAHDPTSDGCQLPPKKRGVGSVWDWDMFASSICLILTIGPHFLKQLQPNFYYKLPCFLTKFILFIDLLICKHKFKIVVCNFYFFLYSIGFKKGSNYEWRRGTMALLKLKFEKFNFGCYHVVCLAEFFIFLFYLPKC